MLFRSQQFLLVNEKKKKNTYYAIPYLRYAFIKKPRLQVRQTSSLRVDRQITQQQLLQTRYDVSNIIVHIKVSIRIPKMKLYINPVNILKKLQNKRRRKRIRMKIQWTKKKKRLIKKV